MESFSREELKHNVDLCVHSVSYILALEYKLYAIFLRHLARLDNNVKLSDTLSSRITVILLQLDAFESWNNGDPVRDKCTPLS